jgi:hypothetical protein
MDPLSAVSALEAVGHFFQGVGSAVATFWDSLGAGRGYVVGAVVTLAGILINIQALSRLETTRSTAQSTRDQEQWDRERAAQLEITRRELYAETLVAFQNVAFGKGKPAAIPRARAARGAVRLTTDNQELISAVSQLSKAAIARREAGTPETRQAWITARKRYVDVARAELGRAAVTIPEEDADSDVPTR